MSALNSMLLYPLFKRLKTEALIELDPAQYSDFLSCFLAYPPQDKEELLRLCKVFWLVRPSHALIFEALFEEEFHRIGAKLYQLLKKENTDYALNPDTSTLGQTHLNEQPIDKPLIDGTPSQSGKLPKQTQLPPNNETSEEWMELLLNVQESKGGPGRREQSPEQQSAKAIEYLFTDAKHLPFTYRKATQAWRRYEGKSRMKETDIIDIKETIKQVSQEKLVTKLVFQKERKSLQQLIWLSDHAVDMVSFETWDNHLYGIISNLSSFRSSKRFYFQCYPTVLNSDKHGGMDFQVFEDRGHTVSHSFQKNLREEKGETLVVVVSDGGAFQQKYEPACLQAFSALFQSVRRFGKIMWFNPVPDWSGSTAGFLSLMLPMYHIDDNSFKKAVFHGRA